MSSKKKSNPKEFIRRDGNVEVIIKRNGRKVYSGKGIALLMCLVESVDNLDLINDKIEGKTETFFWGNIYSLIMAFNLVKNRYLDQMTGDLLRVMKEQKKILKRKMKEVKK